MIYSRILGIFAVFPKFKSSETVLDMISGLGYGIFSMINQASESRERQEDLLKRMAAAHTDTGIFKAYMSRPSLFSIHHYAGPVQYSLEDYINANSEAIRTFVSHHV